MTPWRIPDRDNAVSPANAAALANEEVLTVTALEAMWAAGGKFAEDGEVAQNENKTSVQPAPNDVIDLERPATAAHHGDIVLTEWAGSRRPGSPRPTTPGVRNRRNCARP